MSILPLTEQEINSYKKEVATARAQLKALGNFSPTQEELLTKIAENRHGCEFWDALTEKQKQELVNEARYINPKQGNFV